VINKVQRYKKIVYKKEKSELFLKKNPRHFCGGSFGFTKTI